MARLWSARAARHGPADDRARRRRRGARARPRVLAERLAGHGARRRPRAAGPAPRPAIRLEIPRPRRGGAARPVGAPARPARRRPQRAARPARLPLLARRQTASARVCHETRADDERRRRLARPAARRRARGSTGSPSASSRRRARTTSCSPRHSTASCASIGAHVRGRAIVHDDWGFARARRARPRDHARCSPGPSGTGKTMAAEVARRRAGPRPLPHRPRRPS